MPLLGVQLLQNRVEVLQKLQDAGVVAVWRPFHEAAGNACLKSGAILKEVAQSMQLSMQEVDSMLNLRGDSLEDAYKVLEIEPTASDEEVRKAYRNLVLKHHPDRVATLGEDIRKAAEEKLQRINDAKERIFKARGMK